MINPSALFLPALSFFAALLVETTSVRAAPGDANAAEFYREAFALAESLPGDPEEFTRTASREMVRKVERALDLARKGAAAESVDWGVAWELEGHDGIDFALPGKVRQLTRLGVTYHQEKLERGENSRFAEDMVALIEMSRDFSENQLLIHFLTRLATEGLVTATIAEHAADLPPEVRDGLLSRLENAPAGPTLAEVFETESAATRGQLWNVFAGTADLGEDAPSALTKEGALHDRLRVSSVVAMAEEPPIVGFEDVETQQSFRLRPGEKRGELELVSVDTSSGRALVRQAEESAVVDLAGRKLLPIDLEMAWQRVRFVMAENSEGEEDNVDAEWEDLLAEADRDPLGAFESLLNRYDEDVAKIASILITRHDQLPSPEEASQGLSPLTHSTVPILVRIRQGELRQQAEEELLFAGLKQLTAPDSSLPTSKVTGDRIRVEREEHRLVLESTLPETRKDRQGHPLRLIFPLR